MSFTNCLIVMLGGAIGTFARYGVSVLMLPWSRTLPWGTISINISGSLLIGVFGTLTLASGRYPVPESVRLFVMIGLCGGYTTFSSFSLQTLDLLRNGAPGRALLNALLSVILCILAVSAGHILASTFNNTAHRIAQMPVEEEA
ncbi:MAG: fluoride efflux transporter CrcB [Caulobacteraceae bacterium]